MNPNDHPHGGGEGKSPIGMPSPVTPWVNQLLVIRPERKIRSLINTLSREEKPNRL